MIPEDTDLSNTKEETSTKDTTTSARVSTTMSSWSRLKDPRIVRVSRAFGGKDRHSKVCTVRGLRDRRVRLSVPTAIQLYDLQDRLGLSQPSKVVDWLLNEAKEAIDELPPLQIPQGSSLISQSLLHPMFMNNAQHHHHEFLSPHSDKSLKINSSVGKDKHVLGETSHHHSLYDDQNWGRNHHEEVERSQLIHLDYQNQGTSNDLSRQGIPFPTGSLSYNPLIRWDPSNMTTTLSHDHAQRSHESSTSQKKNADFHHHNFSLIQLPPHIPAGSQSVLVYRQPAGISRKQSFNEGGPSQTSATSTVFESKQAAGFHGLQLSNSSLTSTGPVMRSFQFHMTANLLPQNNDVDEQNNSNQFHSS